MTRVLITGSREWHDIDSVYAALDVQFEKYGPFILVHGAAKDGVDNFAHQWYVWIGEDEGVIEEPHAADWKPAGRNGPTDRGAGLKRNLKMVQLGADICLAFPTICLGTKKNCSKDQHYSHGTDHCMTAAAKALIKIKNYGEPLDRP